MAGNESTESSVRPYTATKDMVDALRMEISSITPKQQEGLSEGIRLITDKIVTDYGRFMPPETLEVAKTTDVRTLLVHNEDFHAIYNNWASDDDTSVDATGVMFHEGRLSIVQDFASQKENSFNIPDEESKQKFIDISKGDEEEARNHIAEMNMGSHLAHETLHQLHAQGMPTYFVESANFYYQRELDKDMPMYTFLPVDSAALAARIYQDTVEKFGDDVHKVFFGTNEDNDLALRIKGYVFYFLHSARELGMNVDNIFQNKQELSK